MSDAGTPHRLRTEFATDPVGIDATAPDLRWRCDPERGATQTAFRVLVASSPDLLAEDEVDVWDSGRRECARPAVTYDGPTLDSRTRYHWTVRVWDEAGEASAWSEPASWETALLDADDWTASWIRKPEDGAFEPGQFSYFRRAFDLDGDVGRARAYVSASHQYALSVNGTEVDRGQSFCYPDQQYYKVVDLDGLLRDGANAIGVLHTWNGEGQGRPEAEPGLLVQVHVELADGSERVIVTDGSWRVREAEWLHAPMRNDEINEPVERIDGRRHPHSWSEPGFDGDWDAVDVVGEHPTDPWERLRCQDREVVSHEVEPVSVEEVDPGTYVADFGKVYSAVPRVRFEDGSADHRVALRAGYRLEDDRRVSETKGIQWTDMRYAYVQRDGGQVFRPFNYLGIRYLQIDDPGEDLDPSKVTLIARHNEVPDLRAATFSSSNGGVDDVWELARHSVRYGSQEQFIDTPTREKGQFLADSLNISWATNRAFEERRLTRQAIGEFVRSHDRYWTDEGRVNAVYPNGDGKRDIPEFSELFPEWIWQYYLTSDDRRSLEVAYPVATSIAGYVADHVDPESGLVANLSGGGGPYAEGIVDWPPEMRYGYDRDWPVRTTVNVLAANAFRRVADIAEALNRPEAEVSALRDRRRALVDAVNEHLLDGDRYVDGASTDGEDRSEHVSQHANAFPLAFDAVPDEVADAIADRVAVGGMRMGPMMATWLVRALNVAERQDAIVDLLTDPEDDGWANILACDGTFTWETWHTRDPDLPLRERQNRSESHAMGATVLVNIQRALLGVRFLEPGAARIEVRPPASGLTSASGRVPTERGPVEVDWEREDGATRLDVTVSWNASATISLPVADVDGSTVTEGGVPVWEDGACDELPSGVEAVGTEGDRIAVEIGAGTYRFIAE